MEFPQLRRSLSASRLHTRPRRTMSPLKPMLFPVANTAVRHSQSGMALCPRILILTIGRSESWPKQLTAKVVCAVVERDDRDAARSTLPSRFSGLLYTL